MKRSDAVGRGSNPEHEGRAGFRTGPGSAFGLALLGGVLTCAYAVEGLAQDASELQAQIERQRAENQALKDKIEQFERVLKTDVCRNPEAAKLLDEEPPAAPLPEPAPAK